MCQKADFLRQLARFSLFFPLSIYSSMYLSLLKNRYVLNALATRHYVLSKVWIATTIKLDFSNDRMIFAQFFSLVSIFLCYLSLFALCYDRKLSIHSLAHTQIFDWHKIKADNFGLLNWLKLWLMRYHWNGTIKFSAGNIFFKSGWFTSINCRN